MSAGRPGTEAPAGWRWFRLTDLARLETGHTPSRNHPEWWGGPIPWISLADIRELDGKVAQDTIEHTNEEGIANSSARLLPEGTVVLSRTASVGFVTIMGRAMATSQDFVNWVCGPELDPRFLAYLLRASRAYIRSLSSGAIHQTVYMPTVESFFMSAPSVSRQREISESLTRHLAAVERARTAAEEQTEAARSLSSSYLRQAFGTPEARAWPRVRLVDVLTAPLRTGISRPTAPSSSKRCLTLSAVRSGTLDLAASKPTDVSDLEAKGNWVLPGAFYVVRGNGNRSLVGRGGFAPQTIEPNVLYPDLLIQVVTDSQVVIPEYLRFVWDSEEVRRDLEGRARTAAGIYKISQGNLAEVKVPLPSVAVQRYVAGLLKGELARAEEAQTSIGEELMRIVALPAALLRRAFAAEL